MTGAPGGPSTPDTLLRPALQLALDVARVAAAASPAVEVPRALRPFLQFARMPDHALTAVRRALDEDDHFRARVEVLADEEELGRAGWLFVTRPPGWREELQGLAEEALAVAEAERQEREERSARRRLAAAEEARQRAEDGLARAQAEAAKAAADLAAERRERRAAQEEASRLGRRVMSLEGERDSARRRAEEAGAEQERLAGEIERLAADVAVLQARLAAQASEVEGGPAPGSAMTGSASAPSAAGPAALSNAPAAGPAPPERNLPAADMAAVARAVAAASVAADALARALAEASGALAGPPSVNRPEEPSAADRLDERPPAPSPALADREGRGATPAAPARRRPAALPPAVFDDTAEAAAHLVRVRDVLVLVDGYNVAKFLWPDVTALELRGRLVDALSELEARTGAGIHVVFDGADLGGHNARPTGRSGVRVSFSPPGVEADDVILSLVDEVPVQRPVVVASSDRRVQDGSRQRGAAVVSSAQFAAVLGRA